MFAQLLALTLFFQAVFGQVEVVPSSTLIDFNGGKYAATTTCTGSVARIDVFSKVDTNILLHELAHAYDCIDNGVMDGSPAPHLCQNPAICAEIYAIHVQYTNDVSSLRR